MGRGDRKVMFASDDLEREYGLLASSRHPEDRRTYEVLQKMRRTLSTQYSFGKRIPKRRIPAAYKERLGVRTLWCLAMPPLGTVFYVRIGKDIRIVDII